MPEAVAKAGSLESVLGIFNSVGKGLENLVSDVKTIKNDITYYGGYGAKAAMGMTAGVLMTGTLTTLSFPIGIAVGTYLGNVIRKKKNTYSEICDNMAVGGFLGGLVHYLFIGANAIGAMVKPVYGTLASMAAKAGTAIASMLPFMATHEYLNRAVITDYQPKPLAKIPRELAGPMLPLLPLIGLNYTVVPEYLAPIVPQAQMYVGSTISALYGMARGAMKPEEKKPA